MLAKLPSFLETKKGPGPGNYDVSMEVKPSAPKFKFGSSKRGGLKTLNVPGPGAYRIKSSIGDVPEYAIPNRPDHFKYI